MRPKSNNKPLVKSHWLPHCSASLAMLTVLTYGSVAQAHGISESSRAAMAEGGLLDYLWLGAEHMLTGYDHLLFLFGVLFFLSSFRDIVRFITAFTVGHCVTLLGATLLGISANPYLIDAVIALTVIYKGFENLDGFQKYLGLKAPNLLNMVFLFGLIHGFGLSTRLQELGLGDEGMIARILAFNVGVELGQIAALAVMLSFFSAWRNTPSFTRFSKLSNQALIVAGVGLFTLQLVGYNEDRLHHDHPIHDELHHHDGNHHHPPGAKDGHHQGADSDHGQATPKERGSNSKMPPKTPDSEHVTPTDGGSVKAPKKRDIDSKNHGQDHLRKGHGHPHKSHERGQPHKDHSHSHKRGYHSHEHKPVKGKVKRTRPHRHGKGPAHSH